MKRLYGFFTIIIAVCVLSNCSAPIGSIDGSGSGGSDYDSMWVIPTRLFYERGEKFIREYDLQIFSSDNGIVRQIDPAETQIIISETSAFGDPHDPVTVTSPHPLVFPGIFRVDIKYNSKAARYTFEVRGYFNPEGDGGWGIGIEWLP